MHTHERLTQSIAHESRDVRTNLMFGAGLGTISIGAAVAIAEVAPEPDSVLEGLYNGIGIGLGGLAVGWAIYQTVEAGYQRLRQAFSRHQDKKRTNERFADMVKDF